MRNTAFSFTLQPTQEQQAAMRRHVGAARFAYNWGLANVKARLERRRQDATVKVPWSGFDLINAFNRWKVSADAGIGVDGKPGLAWRQEVGQQVFEEASVDLGRGLQHWRRGKRSPTASRRPGFPRLRKKGLHDTFRLRNKRGSVRTTPQGLCLPGFGEVKVRESTRALRRLLRPRPSLSEQPRIYFATVVHKLGRWHVRVNVEAPAFHPDVGAVKQQPQTVGIDRGLKAFAVAATAQGVELWRQAAPKPLQANLRRLQGLSRRLSRKQRHSKNRGKARQRLGRLHQHIAHIRRAHVHELSTQVAKTHGHVVLEDLHIAGMLRNPSLARHIADSCWGLFAQQLTYKGTWYRCKVSVVNRFAPTSKTCCRCDWVAETMPLGVRVFVCPACGWQADRDANAAANCARWGGFPIDVAVKQPETLNAGGDSSSGRARRGETGVDEAGKSRTCLLAVGGATPGKGAVDYARSVNRL